MLVNSDVAVLLRLGQCLLLGHGQLQDSILESGVNILDNISQSF